MHHPKLKWTEFYKNNQLEILFNYYEIIIKKYIKIRVFLLKLYQNLEIYFLFQSI